MPRARGSDRLPTWLRQIRHVFMRGLHAALPSHCLICDRLLPSEHSPDSHHKSIHLCCASCQQHVFPNTPRCIGCGITIHAQRIKLGRRYCATCLKTDHQPLCRYAVVASDYLPPIDELIQALKYKRQMVVAQTFADALAIRWLNMAEAPPDCLIPIPASQQSLKRRGYNQAALICQALGQQLNIPIVMDGLRRSSDTTSQTKLNRHDRRHNLSWALFCQANVRDLHVGLVDDVWTTGATLRSAHAALTIAGARSVSFWLAARTPDSYTPEDE